MAQAIIPVHVGVSERRKKLLQAEGVSVPGFVAENLIIDTGSSLSALDQAIIAPLGLKPAGAVLAHTATSSAEPRLSARYDVSLLVPAPDGPALLLGALAVFEGLFRHRGIDGILGRDVLAHCTFIHNAPAGGFMLAY